MICAMMLAAVVTVTGTGRDSIQAAIDEVASAGGGRVTVPAGAHESGSIRLRSGIELHLEKGARWDGDARRNTERGLLRIP